MSQNTRRCREHGMFGWGQIALAWLFSFSICIWKCSERVNQSHTQFSCSFMSNCLQPHGLQHARLPVHHQLPELAQTHVHQVGDAIQPSYSLSSPSPPAFDLSPHQGLFQWVSYLHQVDKVLEFQLQSFSFSISPSNKYSGLISFRIDWFDLLAIQGTLKRVFCSTTVQKHQFFGTQPALISIHDYWKNHSFD